MLNSTEHEIILLINVKMPTIVGILTFMSSITPTSKNFEARKIVVYHHFHLKSSQIFMLSDEHEKSL